MILLLLFAFISGLTTILAPCIWPLLPIVLSSSIAGTGHRRPLGITLGLMVSFSIVTLAISSLVMYFHFDPNVLRMVAVIVIAFFGLTMIIPSLNTLMEVLASRVSQLFGRTQVQQDNHGFIGGFITGVSLGIVWSPCAGPIFATIATLAATSEVSTEAVLITFAYVIGIGIPLFIFAYGGKKIFLKTKFLSAYAQNSWLFGVVMLLTALAIYTGYDRLIQAKLLDYFPQYTYAINSFESNPLIKKQLDALKGIQNTTTAPSPAAGLSDYGPAPEFTGITQWLNTSSGSVQAPVTVDKLKGKVVLVDFWTYTCINCIRTLPHLTSWYDKYHRYGFEIIGVHTPEFAFEKDTKNVLQAMSMYNIHYPVGQDNDYGTWNAYQNQYWPAEYLIDATGTIRHVHFGEGNYDETEKAIQDLLRENGKTVTVGTSTVPDDTPTQQISPETYLGTNRMQYLFPNGKTDEGNQTFTLGTNIAKDSFSFGGTWTITSENAITQKDSVIEYNFYANKVFLVMRPPADSVGQVKVYLDGKLVDDTNAGADVKNGVVTVNVDRLYSLIDLHGKYGNHTLRLEFQTPKTETFAFTFG